MGTAKQADDYCQQTPGVKEDGSQVIYTFRYGEMMRTAQGKRSDLLAIKCAIEEGESMVSIADHYFSQWVRYNKSFDKYHQMIQPPRDFKTEVVLLHGRSGSGKTRAAHSLGEGAWWADAGFDGSWFDGYCGNEVAVFDDIKIGLPYRLMLRLMDRYPCSVPVKGGFANWRPRKMVCTSTVDIESWFPRESNLVEFFRRVTAVISVANDSDEGAVAIPGTTLKGFVETVKFRNYLLNF